MPDDHGVGGLLDLDCDLDIGGHVLQGEQASLRGERLAVGGDGDQLPAVLEVDGEAEGAAVLDLAVGQADGINGVALALGEGHLVPDDLGHLDLADLNVHGHGAGHVLDRPDADLGGERLTVGGDAHELVALMREDDEAEASAVGHPAVGQADDGSNVAVLIAGELDAVGLEGRGHLDDDVGAHALDDEVAFFDVDHVMAERLDRVDLVALCRLDGELEVTAVDDGLGVVALGNGEGEVLTLEGHRVGSLLGGDEHGALVALALVQNAVEDVRLTGCVGHPGLGGHEGVESRVDGVEVLERQLAEVDAVERGGEAGDHSCSVGLRLRSRDEGDVVASLGDGVCQVLQVGGLHHVARVLAEVDLGAPEGQDQTLEDVVEADDHDLGVGVDAADGIECVAAGNGEAEVAERVGLEDVGHHGCGGLIPDGLEKLGTDVGENGVDIGNAIGADDGLPVEVAD